MPMAKLHRSDRSARMFVVALMALLVSLAVSAVCAPLAVASDSQGTGGSEAYALLYKDGTLVFQRGDAPDASRGAVVATYTGFEDAAYGSASQVPWVSERESVQSVRFEGGIKPVSMAYWFYKCTNLESCDFAGLDASAVTNMHAMFRGCTAVTSLDLSDLDLAAVTDLSQIMYDCTGLETFALPKAGLPSATDLSFMFRGCSSLAAFELASSAPVTDSSSMFWHCSALETLDLSGMNTTAATAMSNMFGGCSSLAKVVLGEGFSFTGSGTEALCALPAPAASIDGADGNWYNGATAYAPADVPGCVAATYTAVPDYMAGRMVPAAPADLEDGEAVYGSYAPWPGVAA